MRTLAAVILSLNMMIGLSGCASVSAVMQSDAPFSEKMKKLGAIVGSYFEGPSGSRSDAVKKYNYAGRGDFLEVESASLTSETASPGQTVEAKVTYVVLAPDATQQVKVTESRTLVSPTDSLMLSQREVTREQGSHSSTMKFTMPSDIAKGGYTLVTSVSDGTQTKTVKSALRVI